MKYKEQTSKLIRADIIRMHLKKNTIRKIANECNCSTRTVIKWIKHYKANNEGDKRIITDDKSILKKINDLDLSRKATKRKSSILKKVANFISKKCADKTTGGKDNCSIRKIVAIGNRKFKLNKDIKHKLTIGKVHRFLLKKFGRPKKLIKKPLLKDTHIKSRRDFTKYIIDKNIDYRNIFFTDEKRFLISFVPNPQNNKIRLTKESKRKLKQNNDKIRKKLTIEVEKHPKGIMVAGGVSSFGVGKLNFCVGTMNSFAYKQTLINYENDMEYFRRLGINLIFQQDNAPCHTSKDSREYLKRFENKLKFWPPNSPDLSPIETIWSFIQQKLEGYKFQNLDELKKKILFFWNRIPADYCARICEKFYDDITQIYKTGKLKDKSKPYKKVILKKKGTYEDSIDNIVYNEKTLKKFLQNKRKSTQEKVTKKGKILNEIKKKNIQQILKVKTSSMYFDVCLREIINEKENELKGIKEELDGLKNVDTDTYFKSLSKDIKQKLIGFNEVGADEETQADEKSLDVIDTFINNQKRIVKKKIEDNFNKLLSKRLLIKRIRKEVKAEMRKSN